MNQVASLPMYDWPETRLQVDQFYKRLRGYVPGLPDSLCRPDSGEALHALWREPGLVFSQTCWGPLGAGLAGFVHVLAQPLYDDVPGGDGVRYRSAIVMCQGVHCPVPDHEGPSLPAEMMGLRAAVNGPDSLSGCIAPGQDMGLPDLAADALVTGSHRASIRAVADGSADFAAIDCRSWALAKEHEPAARALVVTGWTGLRPGLPYITARATPVAVREALALALGRLGAKPYFQSHSEGSQ